MGLPKQAISSVLKHAPLKAIEHLPGVNLIVDDPTMRVEEFFGTDGETDVYVFDVEPNLVNIALIRNFDPGEDYFRFTDMGGSDLTVGDIEVGFNFVLFSGDGAANLLVFGVPYQQDIIEQMISPFDGRIVFDDPFDFA